MSDINIKQGDLFPPLVAVLYDTTLPQNAPGAAIDLSTATTISMFWKGQTTPVKTGSCTKLSVVTPTATVSTSSNILTVVSSFTSIQKGSSVIGIGIPLGAIVGDFNSTAQTITLTDNLGNPLIPTAAGSNVTLTINKGTVQYQWQGTDTAAVDVYSIEFEITWPSSQVQTVPNTGYRSMTISATLDGT